MIGSAHWLTDGTHKEIILRNVMERHLPETLKVCTGFVYKTNQISTQIDLLIINESGYTLFKEGELVIVTPHAVRALVEVKTTCEGPSKLKETLKKLAENARLAEQEGVQNRGDFWCGLFVYESSQERHDELLEALSEAHSKGDFAIQCVALGPDIFAKFYTTGGPGPMWITHNCKNFAAGCFIADMLATLTDNPGISDFPILNKPILGGKVAPVSYICHGDTKPVRVESIVGK